MEADAKKTDLMIAMTNRDMLGLSMIVNPELEAAKESFRMLFIPSSA
jgi:hypothetical protein